MLGGRRLEATRLGARTRVVLATFAFAAVGYVAIGLVGAPSSAGGPAATPEPSAVVLAGMSVLGFIAWVLPGAVLALQGRGPIATLPLASYFVAFAILAPLLGSALPSGLVLQRAVEAALLVLPVVLVSRDVERKPLRPLDETGVGALALCVATAATVASACGLLVGRIPSHDEVSRLVQVFVACFAFGMLAGTSRPGWPWAQLLVPASMAAWVFASPPFWAVAKEPWPPAGDLLALPLAPAVLVTLAGAAWQPLRERLGRDRGTYALALLVGVNGLNAADALLTEVAVRSGGAAELNPVASGLGSVGKVALVGAASYLLYRVRPGALLWPALTLALVIAYQAAGALFGL